MTGVDMCEIAANSCYHSGWPDSAKAYWLGKNFLKEGPAGPIQKLLYILFRLTLIEIPISIF